MRGSQRTFAWLGTAAVAVVVAGVSIFAGCTGDFSGASAGRDFLQASQISGSFSALQVDPRSEDSAGPQFVVAEDVDQDGRLDVVSAWNQSQPVQIHFQRRSAVGQISFETLTLAGNIPVVRVAGLTVGDFDGDDAIDVAVLVKQSGLPNPGCLDGAAPMEGGYSGVIIIYRGPADSDSVTQALAWDEVAVESSRLAGLPGGEIDGPPEEEGYTAMTAGDMDTDGDIDLVVAWNPLCGDGTPETLMFTNQGTAAVRDGTWTASRIPDAFPKFPLLQDEQGLATPFRVKDVALGDFDGDGDLDIVASYPDAGTLNVRWYRNPARDVADDGHISDGNWQVGSVGQISPKDLDFTDLGGADGVRVADVDGDGRLDVVVRSGGGRVVQWLKGPALPTTLSVPGIGGPVRHIPWQVYTMAEFGDRTPQSIALGDLDGDDQIELVAGADGALAWFNPTSSTRVHDEWVATLLVDDAPGDADSMAAPVTDPNAVEAVTTGTYINAIIVVDLDGDGANDIVATFDRSGLSGLSNDALVWFRNQR